ncbi:unnamed protein product, partial [Allacma fusca]
RPLKQQSPRNQRPLKLHLPDHQDQHALLDAQPDQPVAQLDQPDAQPDQPDAQPDQPDAQPDQPD